MDVTVIERRGSCLAWERFGDKVRLTERIPSDDGYAGMLLWEAVLTVENFNELIKRGIQGPVSVRERPRG